uniref:flotillin family protein n=1 Tax=Aminobacter niigataensis TaxID=83265 RepID=UPI002852BDB9|nr:flotillin domain-containing protein [Aminobacter niigataensis]WMD00149.1 flotillin domain-containing protein [Aminobacter niigataensis]
MTNWVLIALVIALILLVIFAKFYQRSSKDVAFVRTGFGGERVVLTGGALAIPIFHQVTPVSMSTMRLDVLRTKEHALITKDHMRVDVEASFYMRVKGSKEGVALAAQTLGARTLNAQAIQELLEGKLVDAVRAAVAEMLLDQLHGDSRIFIERVRFFITEADIGNGLELEAVSLSRLDQAAKNYFDASNTFDAQGLIRIARETEDSRRTRNEIEKSTELKIQDTNLATEEKTLLIKRDSEFARLQADLEVAQRKAEQSAAVARHHAEQRCRTAEAEISQDETIAKMRLLSERAIDVERIAKDRELRHAEIERERLLEIAEIERDKLLKIASEERLIAVLAKQKERALNSKSTNDAEAAAAIAEEAVSTARDVARADRERKVSLVRAERAADEKAIAVKVAAGAELEAAGHLAEARRLTAVSEADALTAKSAAEADGRRKLNEAANMLSSEQVAMQLRLAAVEALPSIIRESVKPMENIDGIKVIDLGGLNVGAQSSAGGNADGGGGSSGQPSGGGQIDRIFEGALKYRLQAPVVDNLLREVGLAGLDGGLEQIMTDGSGILAPSPRQSLPGKPNSPARSGKVGNKA